MYTPAHFAASEEAIEALLRNSGAANLVTMTPDGLLATLLPFIYDPSVGDHGALQTHMARNNPQWSTPVTGEALMILQGPDAYISPSWYASKAEHGRVVPTWNYSTAHVYGRLVIHDDGEWLGKHVRQLSDHHESAMARPWSVDEAPQRFIAGQLKAIVGVELVMTRVEAKAKLSQNRTPADVEGVIAGLRSVGDAASAADVERARNS
ncbi:FMN-binding negative transcriptional regulator [Paenarthrobacter sp. AT5]|uniref:FMN-binding negative transcriptional regulator n=1 Tax=Paenarthrobacter TaxID=1742992 RepID=UPI001A99298E|nr:MULTISPECIES: FMN-binding negative transcriptional regulator [Paenarthrobacter]QSZ51929.1 transcriptional regulator [Paenarthrobacter ureafaciens]WOC61348.1 FMN-binding negative transcriptional regulator [Paenarthrobacter sp. AT5]BCW82559.1 transcriptional regulator [Arthrobacter sp. NicSoilE8]